MTKVTLRDLINDAKVEIVVEHENEDVANKVAIDLKDRAHKTTEAVQEGTHPNDCDGGFMAVNWEQVAEDDEELVTDGGVDDYEAFEHTLDDLRDGLFTAYAAGYAKAVEDADNHDCQTTDVESLKKFDYIQESHYYFWDGRTLPLEFWLREQFGVDSDDDEELVTDGGLPPYVERTADGVRCTVCGNEAPDVPSLTHECIYQNDLVADGGRDECAECGAILPKEIEPGTGVYCTSCGTGQHVTDGGREPLGDADLTAFQRDILSVLAEESMYGLAIKDELETLYGHEINHGRLYPNLDDLVDAGLVAKSELDKRTNSYELTDAGLDVACERLRWLAEQLGFDVIGSTDDSEFESSGHETILMDGGEIPTHDDVAAEHDGAERLDGEFTSGDGHMLYDDVEDKRVAPENACCECGEYGALRCSSCGRALCGMHSEVGGGFCADFTERDGEPGCEIGEEFHEATHLMEEAQ